MIEDAVERMAALIREGKPPRIAAMIAAHESGLEASAVASATAEMGAAVARRRRQENRILTQEEAREFLRKHLSPRIEVDRDARRAAATVFFATMTVEPAGRNIVRDWNEATDDLDQDQWLIAAYELHRLWTFLPDGWDPRPSRSTPIPKTSFMWPLHERCAWWRWVSRG
jgi:hypothetical protein